MELKVKFDSITAEEIAAELERKIREKHPNIEVQKGAVVKVNNVWKNAMTFHEPGEAVSPTLYLDSAVEAVNEGMVSIHEVTDSLVETYENSLHNIPTMNVVEQINMKNLFATVVNAEANQERLAMCPHSLIPNTDLAVVCRIKMSEEGSALVTNELCGMLKATPDEVVQRSLRNISNLDQWNVRSMQDVLCEQMGLPEEFRAEMFGDEDIPQMLVITDNSQMNAIGPFVNPELRKEIADKLGCEDGEGYYIIPSSRFETIAIRADMDWKSIEEMVSEVNATEVAKEDQLSDKVYHVDAQSLKLTIAGEAENMTESFRDLETQTFSMRM